MFNTPGDGGLRASSFPAVVECPICGDGATTSDGERTAAQGRRNTSTRYRPVQRGASEQGFVPRTNVVLVRAPEPAVFVL